MNFNVKLGLIVSFLTSLTRGIWAFTTLSLYLKLITGSTAQVGLAEGIQGCLQAFCAIIAGFLVDALSREFALVSAGVLGLLAIGLTLFGLYYDDIKDDHRYIVLCLALSLWGSYQGFWITSLDTIFADSIRTGERSKLNTYRFILQQISGISGPLIALAIFLYHGDEQSSLETLRTVFAVGVALSIIPCTLLFSFRDKYSLGLDSESHYAPLTEEENEYILLDDGMVDSVSPTDLRLPPNGGYSRLHGYPSLPNTRFRIQPYLVPYITVISDVIAGLGSGMTVKFFPLYFKENLGLTPAAINIVYIALSFFMICSSVVIRKCSKSIGQVNAIILFCYIGHICLGCMGFAKEQAAITLPLYFFSTLMHSTRPLKKAIMMDFAEKRKRGWFNSFDSITRFGWSGSAIIGGISADKFGYGNLFLITAGLQFISTSILLPLLTVVPHKEVSRMESSGIVESNS